MVRGTRLSAGIGVSNLFNRGVVVSTFVVESEVGSGLTFNQADLYAGLLNFQQLFVQQKLLTDPRFLMANGYQPPRSARVMIKWTF
jgi:hypothetical protein